MKEMPKQPPRSDAVDQLLSAFPDSVRSLALSARSLVLGVLPGATEIADSKARVIGYGYGPGYKGIVATLILSKAGVKIGLAQGASLPDPGSLLQGAGKVHRHIQVNTEEALQRPEVRQLVEAALDAWQTRSQSPKR